MSSAVSVNRSLLPPSQTETRPRTRTTRPDLEVDARLGERRRDRRPFACPADDLELLRGGASGRRRTSSASSM